MKKMLSFTRDMENEVKKTIQEYHLLSYRTSDFIKQQTKDRLVEDLKILLNSELADKFFVDLFKHMRIIIK